MFWWRRRVRRERHRLCADGWRLIHELKAYSAWLDLLRGEPSLAAEPEQLTAAQALLNARTIAQTSFPELSSALLRLLQADARLMAHLWQRKLLRLSEPGAWVHYERDPAYWEIRDGQDELIGEIMARCRALMGARAQAWHGTDMNSEFFSSRGLSTGAL